MAVALLREHDQAQRDDAVDGGEGDDGQAEPRLGLHVAVDVAAVEKRAQPALPAGLRRFARLRSWGHRCAGTLPVVSGAAGASMAPIGSADGGGTTDRRALGQLVEAVELRRHDRPQRQMAGGQALDAAGRVELRPFGAQGGDGVALAAQLAGELATRSACSVELNLIL